MKYRYGLLWNAALREGKAYWLVSVMLYLVSCNTASTELFDGETFHGWEGDTINTWSIVDGVIVAGSLDEMVPHNNFLCTTKSYGNFVLNLKYKIEGTEGFVNGGVQFRSQRITNPSYEMIGYQADIGNKLDGALYDESRRKSFLAGHDTLKSSMIARHGDWNDMQVIANNREVKIYINGQQTVDYIETDEDIPQMGKIALQIHGDGITRISYKHITIENYP